MLYQLNLTKVLSNVLKTGVSVENDNLEVPCQVSHSVNGTYSYPHVVVLVEVAIVEVFEVELGHQVLLFAGDASILDKVTENTLKCDDYDWSVHMAHPSLVEMSECPFIKLCCCWVQLDL